MKIALGSALAFLLALPLTGTVAGCADKAAAIPPLTPVSTTSGRVSKNVNGDKLDDEAAAAAAAKNGRDGVTTQSLHLSETIAKACNLPRSEATPHFGFDSTAISEEERVVLAAFAKCLAGPLKGKGVLLVGRADLRGEPEYNMGLGGSRSDGVKRYLIDLGVADSNIKASSRGEIDATGTDEEGMARDRRVDIDVR